MPVTPESSPEFAATTLEAWANAAAKSAPGGDVDALNWHTPDGITVKPLYTAADLEGLQHTDTLPGFEPYLRASALAWPCAAARWWARWCRP